MPQTKPFQPKNAPRTGEPVAVQLPDGRVATVRWGKDAQGTECFVGVDQVVLFYPKEPYEALGDRPIKEPCCEAWARAHDWETDNESYSSLVWYDGSFAEAKAMIGTRLPSVKFCPWCGAEKAPLNDYTDLAARKID